MTRDRHLLERLAERGTPVGAEAMIARLDAEFRGTELVVGDGLSGPGRPARAPIISMVTAFVLVLLVGVGSWLLAPGDPIDPRGASPLPQGSQNWPSFSLSALLGERESEPLEGVEVRWSDPGAWRWEHWVIDPGTRLEGIRVTYEYGGVRYEEVAGEVTTTELDEPGEPLGWFGQSVPPALAWMRARPDARLHPQLVQPEHPLASLAALAEAEEIRFRMEFTDEGIPLLKEASLEGEPDFWVTSLERREVTEAEITTGHIGGSDPELEGVAPTDLRVLRTVDAHGLIFKVVTYSHPAGTCLEVETYLPSGNRVSRAGGCDAEALTPEVFSVGLSGVRVEERWFNLLNGAAASEVATVRATLPDGTTFTDHPENGVWLIVLAGEEGSQGEEIPEVHVAALDAQGRVLSEKEFPPPGGP